MFQQNSTPPENGTSYLYYTYVRSPITESMMWDIFTFSYVVLVKLGAPAVIVAANLRLCFMLRRIWSMRETFRRNNHDNMNNHSRRVSSREDRINRNIFK